MEAPESETFLDALTEASTALFLLVVGRTGTALWPCPPGQEKAAQRFATVVSDHAREADPSLLGAIDDARERLNRARADTPELIEARRKVLELARRLVAPPEALRAAASAI